MSCKTWKGTFTVEAAMIVPIVLFLYLSILSVSLFLYDRCVGSQNCFLLGLRSARYTCAEENYGEVIYGEESYMDAKEYVQERWQRKRRYDMGGHMRNILCEMETYDVRIGISEGETMVLEKRIKKLNPVDAIRERRKD